MIQSNAWYEVDVYFRSTSGSANLQQLLIFKYKVGITRKQFQIAMVWMTDTENFIVHKLSMLTLWQEKSDIFEKLQNRLTLILQSF